MKYSLTILGCLFVVAQGVNQKVVDQIITNMRVLTDKCLAETGASGDDLYRLTKNKMPSTHEGKCLIFCISKHLNVQNEDGTINKEHANENKQLLEEDDPEFFEKANANFLKCADSVTINEDPCVTATDLAVCWVDENEKTGVQCNIN